MTIDSTVDDATLIQLMHGLADAVILCDPDRVIIFWNGAAQRVFGWTTEEAVGKSLDLIVPEKQRRAHNDGYAQVMATGVTRYGDDLLRVPSLHADGQRRSIAFTVTLLTDDDGTVTGIAAVVRSCDRRQGALNPGMANGSRAQRDAVRDPPHSPPPRGSSSKRSESRQKKRLGFRRPHRILNHHVS